MKLLQIVPITGSAIATTFSLFYMMQSLVAGGEVQIDETPTRVWFDPVQRIEEPVVNVVDRLTRPDDPVDPPDDTVVVKEDYDKSDGDRIVIPIGPPPFDPDQHEEIALAQMDGERIPIVRIKPAYPRRCQERGISGWVVLDFDVTKLGTVENASIVAADPSGCFDRTALKAIARFKYRPTILDGQPMRSNGVRFRMGFTMAEG